MPFMNISRSLILSVNAVDCSYSLCRHYSKKVIYSEKFNSDIISQKSVHAANRTCNIFAENTQIITCCPDNIFSRSKCGSFFFQFIIGEGDFAVSLNMVGKESAEEQLVDKASRMVTHDSRNFHKSSQIIIDGHFAGQTKLLAVGFDLVLCHFFNQTAVLDFTITILPDGSPTLTGINTTTHGSVFRITPDIQKILYAGLYLQLYNIVDSTVLSVLFYFILKQQDYHICRAHISRLMQEMELVCRQVHLRYF